MGTTPCYTMLGCEIRFKLPELKRETVGVQEGDWSSKLKGKTYADLKQFATPKNIFIGDTVLLRAEKTNKLSTKLNPAPFKVVQKTGREVTLRNETGVELKRNTAFGKKYNKQDDVSRGNGNGDQVVHEYHLSFPSKRKKAEQKGSFRAFLSLLKDNLY